MKGWNSFLISHLQSQSALAADSLDRNSLPEYYVSEHILNTSGRLSGKELLLQHPLI